MNVLVIPEDFRLDQYILKPLIVAMMAAVGKPTAKVQILTDPLLGSVTAAMSWSNLEEIFDRYRAVDIFLLVIDRDLDPNRRMALDNLERQAAGRCVLLAENAWQEIEVWALAAQDLPPKWKWAKVRSEQHPKEVYFEPFVASRGLQDEPGRGREPLGREAAAQYKRVRKLCPEDVASLENRVRQAIPAGWHDPKQKQHRHSVLFLIRSQLVPFCVSDDAGRRRGG